MPPPSKIAPLSLTVLVDASHASDLSTRRSVTGYIIVLGRAIISWYSKRQNTVETSSYGSELVALRIAMEALLDVRYTLRMMGIPFEKTSTVLCDNQSVVINMQNPSSMLKKKHNSCAYHKCREMTAASITRLGHIPGSSNLSDILTKPIGPIEYYKYLKDTMYHA